MLDPDPPAPPTSPAGTAWLSRAQALARRVNLGWCVDQLVVVLPVTAAVATALVLYLRMAGIADGWVYLTAVLALLGAGIYAWQRARNRFIDRRQALVRLESSLHLDAALSTAAQGIGSWPEMSSAQGTELRWRWERTFLPSLLSLLLIGLAVLWPIPSTLLARNSPLPKPRNIQALESILEQLKEEPLIAEEDVSTLDREISKLGKGQESLYKPSTLEAADHLAKRTSEALSHLAQSSASASRALQAAVDAKGGANVRAQMVEELEAAVKQMANAAMKAPPRLREALKDAAGHRLQELDPAAAEQLQAMLDHNQQQFQKMLEQLAPGQFPGAGSPGDEGNGEPGEGGQLGSGGQEHGAAPPSPLQFHGDERAVDGGKLEGLSPSANTSPPGELLELRAVRPPDPGASQSIESAGKVRHESGGGARLWKENLDPDEQRFLGEFYR